jgi:hypothetical protein
LAGSNGSAGLVTEIEVARRKLLDALANANERLHLGGDVQALLPVPADIQGNDADRIARDEKRFPRGIVEHEREDAVHALEELLRRLLFIEVQDHLAIGGGLENVVGLQRGPQRPVVVDLAVDRQRRARARVDQWLRAVLDIDD